MRKTKSIYSWFRTLSAVLAVCFLMTKTTTAQSHTNQSVPIEVSEQESSDIQDFMDWWTFIFRYYKIKITTTDMSVEGGDSIRNNIELTSKQPLTPMRHPKTKK